MFKSGYIAILGAPNAGKSTLLNAILGQKLAAVTDKPQTTRRRFEGIHTTETSQMIFLDTPGIHESTKQLNQFMLEEVVAAVQDADVLLYLVDAQEATPMLLQSLFQKNRAKPSMLVLNKMDKVLPEKGMAWEGILTVYISALYRTGISELIRAIESLLPEGPMYYDDEITTPSHLRDIASELIREAAMELTYQEIPYSIAVEIVFFKEEPGITSIVANVIVESASQKGMVIGKEARCIREIGIHARRNLEKLLETRVFLELKVKVDKKWTKDERKLKFYGYRRSLR